MKEQILKLRQEGKTYNEIKSIIGCSKGTISYHCGEGQKEKNKQRLINNRKNNIGTILSTKWDNFKKRKGNKYKITYDQILNKFGENPTCYLTGDVIDLLNVKSYHFDHIIPVSKGGDDSLDNLGLTTRDANQVKHDLLLEDLLIICEKILKQFNKI